MPAKRVSEIEYCTAYRQAFEEGKTYDDLALLLGMTRAAVHTRKYAYARKGCKFPELADTPRAKRGATVSALNSILAGRKVR
jgi:hypothetical protein